MLVTFNEKVEFTRNMVNSTGRAPHIAIIKETTIVNANFGHK